MAANAAAEEDTNAELLRTHSTIVRDTLAHVGSMCLKCALELDIPGVISSHGGTMTLSDLVSELDIPRSRSSSIRRIMRVLVYKGYFSHDKKLGTYSLTALSKALVLESPISFSAFVMVNLHSITLAPWNNLSTFCRFDEEMASTLFELEYGKSLWQLGEEQPEISEMFSEAMNADSRATMKPLLEECAEKFQGVRTLVDVGGGAGTMAMAIAEAFPHIKCTVYDLPHVVAKVPEGSPVQAVGGSMFDHIPPADVVFMKIILHNWSDEDCVKILKLCKEAIPSKDDGGKVMIVDIVMDDDDNLDLKTEGHLFFDMIMMAYHGGRERQEHEWKKIFIDAGFADYKITPLGFRSLIEVFP